MATIVTRAGKGAPLSFSEVDANFTNLNTFIGGFRYQTAAGRTINNSNPVIVFDAQIYDSGGGTPWYNSVTGVMTVPTAGLWLASSSIQTNAVNISATQSFSVLLSVNGGTAHQFGQVVGTGNASSFYCINGSVPLRLNAGDLVSVTSSCSTATTSSFVGYQNFFAMTLLGA